MELGGNGMIFEPGRLASVTVAMSLLVLVAAA
jgi:hypothetical protein